jgi:hypothetical protein
MRTVWFAALGNEQPYEKNAVLLTYLEASEICWSSSSCVHTVAEHHDITSLVSGMIKSNTAQAEPGKYSGFYNTRICLSKNHLIQTRVWRRTVMMQNPKYFICSDKFLAKSSKTWK